MFNKQIAALLGTCLLAGVAAGCGGGGSTAAPPPPAVYTLAVNSASPASGIPIAVTPADNNLQANGTTPFTRAYSTGTMVTLTAPATAAGNRFSAWSGCTSATGATCSVTMNANSTVTATYAQAHAPTTYFVSGTGSDAADGLTQATAFLTLQHAAGVVLPGDTVYAMNGTYTNTCAGCDVLDISTPGTPAAWITFTAFPGQTPTIAFNGWEGILFKPTAAYIEVSGFTVQGNNYNVTLQGALNQSYTNPDPAYNGNCISADGRQGTATARPHHLRILNNVIFACGGAGVGTAWSDYVTISGNTIYDTSWYSIYGASAISNWESWNADTTTGYKMFITGNRIFGNANLVPTLGSTVATDGEGIIIDSNRNSAYQASIGLDPYVGRTYIANNVVYNNGSAGIEVFESDHVDVVNNSTYDDVYVAAVSGRGEMNVNAASDVNVFNNIFVAAPGQNPATVCCNASQVALDYNVYYGGANFAGTVSGAHDVSANPLYVDAADANRRNVSLAVSAGSPALGTGTSQLAPSTDFAGHARPGAGGYDRGAYQQ